MLSRTFILLDVKFCNILRSQKYNEEIKLNQKYLYNSDLNRLR